MLQLTVKLESSGLAKQKIDKAKSVILRAMQKKAMELKKQAVYESLNVYSRRIYDPNLEVNKAFMATEDDLDSMNQWRHPQPYPRLLNRVLHNELNQQDLQQTNNDFKVGIFSVLRLNANMPLEGTVEGAVYPMPGKISGLGYWVFQEYGTLDYLESFQSVDSEYMPTKTIEGASRMGKGIPPARGFRSARLQVATQWKSTNPFLQQIIQSALRGV